MLAVILSNRCDQYVGGAIDTLNLVSGWDDLVVVDDSGDRDHRAQLAATGVRVIPVSDAPAGYVAAMRRVFEVFRDQAGEHALFWEEDFRALAPIDAAAAVAQLEAHSLAQVAFLRGPWFGNEHTHGGVIEAREHEGGVFDSRDGLVFHADHWTGNPHVLPAWVWGRRWPDAPWSESQFGRSLFAEGYRCAYQAGVQVDHIGIRAGTDY